MARLVLLAQQQRRRGNLTKSVAITANERPRRPGGGRRAIVLVRDGDVIALDAEAGTIELEVGERDLAERRMVWHPRPHDFQSGALWKYAQIVGDACHGAVTHHGAKAETHVYADI